MKKEILILNATMRKKKGKSESRRSRFNNKFPSIIYGKNFSSLSIELDQDKIFQLQKKPNFYSNTMSININFKNYFVKVKEVQWHPFKQKLMHIDFLIKK